MAYFFFHSHHFDDTRPGKPVNIQKIMENRHVQWINPLFLWSCSIAMLNYQRVDHEIWGGFWNLRHDDYYGILWLKALISKWWFPYVWL
jgi:hypothetical protein